MDFQRVATFIIAVIVVLIGGIVFLVTDKISFTDWLQCVAIGGGLLGVGLGIDAHSRP